MNSCNFNVYSLQTFERKSGMCKKSSVIAIIVVVFYITAIINSSRR